MKLDVVPAPPETHLGFLTDFIALERAVGGPDPHMRIVCEGLAAPLAVGPTPTDEEASDRAWLAGCYVGPYNVASCEVLRHFWPTPESVAFHEGAFHAWVRLNWPGLSFRRERRAIRTPRKFAAHMIGYAHWVLNNAPFLRLLGDPDRVWARLMAIPGNGRYGTIKLYEALHRLGVVSPPFPDIRPAGGWSPRVTLAWLYPDAASALTGNDAAVNLELADTRSAMLKRELELRLGPVDWYTLEVTLCEYGQAWRGGQYPGRAHDSELGHCRKVMGFWGDQVPFRVLDLRREMFPVVALGEAQGWEGRREELGVLPSTQGYMWSDLSFDYLATRSAGDWAHPILRHRR